MDTLKSFQDKPTNEPFVDEKQFAPPANTPLGVPPMAPRRSTSSRRILIIGLVISMALILGVSIFLSKKSTPKENPPVSITESPTVTPTPVRTPSALASQSAFLQLEVKIASLSSAIQNYVTVDSSLSPPTIDLPLGFQQ